jgi:hypothetical protein
MPFGLGDGLPLSVAHLAVDLKPSSGFTELASGIIGLRCVLWLMSTPATG